jgi:hypothetical protein
VDSTGEESLVAQKERSPRMYKTRGSQEKQGEGLAAIPDLELDGIQAALLERTKHADLVMAVALLEQDAEELGGRWYERKTTGQGHRGRYEQTSVVVEGARCTIHPPFGDCPYLLAHVCNHLYGTNNGRRWSSSST